MDIKRLNENLEKLTDELQKSRIKEYVIITESKRKLFMINFISGVGKGLGYIFINYKYKYTNNWTIHSWIYRLD